MVTRIRDLARETGISITAISQILNNKGERFSDETKKKVFDAVEKMNYKPNYYAKNMIKNDTETVGMIVPEVTDPFFSLVVKGVEDYLNKRGYSLILCNSSHDPVREQKYIEKFIYRKLEGVIIASPNKIIKEVVEVLNNSRIPYLLLDRNLNKNIGSKILIDEETGISEAISYLIKMGHRKIGILASDNKYYELRNRFNMYIKCMELNNITVQDNWISRGSLTFNGGYSAAKELLSKSSVTAIFAENDQLAVGAYAAIYELGLKIPDDISIIGFDGIEMSEYLTPPLTTIAIPVYEMGQNAARTIIHEIINHDYENKDTLLKTNFIIRKSVKRIDNV